MMDERERENEATFKDHNTHIQRGPKWNSDDPPTIPRFLSSVWVWSRNTMVEIVLNLQWIDRSHHITREFWGDQVELPPAKKIQWLIQYTFYLPCTCRCGNHRIRDGWNETTMWLLCTLVNSVMGEVSDEPCSLRMYIYIYVTISFDRFKYIYIPYINQSNKNEPTTNKYTSRYAVDGINHLR